MGQSRVENSSVRQWVWRKLRSVVAKVEVVIGGW